MSNREKFEQFHSDNPHILQEIIRMVEQAVQSGEKKLGIRWIVEVLRWNKRVLTQSEDFKLPNAHIPYYTRLIDKVRPDLGHHITRATSQADFDE